MDMKDVVAAIRLGDPALPPVGTVFRGPTDDDGGERATMVVTGHALFDPDRPAVYCRVKGVKEVSNGVWLEVLGSERCLSLHRVELVVSLPEGAPPFEEWARADEGR